MVALSRPGPVQVGSPPAPLARFLHFSAVERPLACQKTLLAQKLALFESVENDPLAAGLADDPNVARPDGEEVVVPGFGSEQALIGVGRFDRPATGKGIELVCVQDRHGLGRRGGAGMEVVGPH